MVDKNIPVAVPSTVLNVTVPAGGPPGILVMTVRRTTPASSLTV